MMTEKRTAESTAKSGKIYIPAADIYETQDLYSLKLEMPGVSRDSLEVVIDDNELKIYGKGASLENGETLKYSEFESRDFQRIFKIGNDIDRNRIDAKLENGILSLTLHKTEEVKPKKITINQIN